MELKKKEYTGKEFANRLGKALFIVLAIMIVFFFFTFSSSPCQQLTGEEMEYQKTFLGQPKTLKIEGCEYLFFKSSRGTDYSKITHKGNCENCRNFIKNSINTK